MALLFAIIVPFKSLNKFVLKCIEECLNQSIRDFEIILLPDEKISLKELENKFGKKSLQKIKVIATGANIAHGIISAKRNIGIKNTRAKFLGFVDSDAYPQKQWLESALPLLQDSKVGIVGGPNLAPKNIGFWEKIIIKSMNLDVTYKGLYSVFNTLGKYKGYRKYKEFASSNLLMPRELCLKIGMFDEDYLTGEDMKLCAEARKTGKLILFNKETAVHHHSRPNLGIHFKRIMQYARGKHITLRKDKKIPVFNWMLSAFSLLIFFSLAIIFFPMLWQFYAIVFGIYFFVIAADCVINGIFLELPFCMLTVFLTHFAYGLGSIQGFFGEKA